MRARINVSGKEVSRRAFKRSLSKGNPFVEGNNREARRKAEREQRRGKVSDSQNSIV